jgi:hypothetical protein
MECGIEDGCHEGWQEAAAGRGGRRGAKMAGDKGLRRNLNVCMRMTQPPVHVHKGRRRPSG